MDVAIIILNILVIVGIAIISLAGKIYLPKYVAEKAKNLATKEDIEGITDQIENVKSSYAHSLEKAKSKLQVKSALQQAFQSKSLEAIIAVNNLLVEIHLYCWKEIVDRSPAEHYVWSVVDESKENRGFHYFRVAIDKTAMIHGLFLTDKAKDALTELASQIGCLSSMELALSGSDLDPIIEDSASSGYESGIKAVESCRDALKDELSLNDES